MNTCSGFSELLPRRLRERLGIPFLAKPLLEPRMRLPNSLEWMKVLCILPNLRKVDPPDLEQTKIEDGRGCGNSSGC
jgi:hypothetical protein